MRRQAQRFMAAGLFLALLFGVVSGATPGSARADDGKDEAFETARGFYEVGPGEFLYLGGTASAPLYELGGASVGLRLHPDSRYRAGDGSGLELAIVRARDGAVAGLEVSRPDEAQRFAPRLDRFREQGVTIDAGDVTLAGTLVVPSVPGPFPAVVMVHGAERGDRNTYRVHAHHFAAAGVAALIYDRRGTGESGGAWHGTTFDDLAADALAGVSFLRSHDVVDRERVGVRGISQGAWVAPMAAAASDEVAFVVAVSASGVTPAEQELWRIGNQLRYRDLSERAIRTTLKTWRMLYTVRPLVDAGLPLSSSTPGFWFLSMDPDLDSIDVWRGVQQPVLAIWGELDCQVPAHDSLSLIREALTDSGNGAARYVILPEADHMMTLVPPCSHELGWHHEPRMHWAPGYRETIAAWILAQGDPTRVQASAATVRGQLSRAPGEVTGAQLMDVTAARDPAIAGASLLQWTAIAREPVRWHETAAARLILLGAASLAIAAGAAGTAISRLRTRGVRRARSGTATSWLSFSVLVSGTAALLASLWTLVELMILSDVHIPQSFGSPLAFGLSAAFLASMALAVTVALTSLALAGSLVRARRSRANLHPTVLVTLGAGLLVTLWCLGWGLLVV